MKGGSARMGTPRTGRGAILLGQFTPRLENILRPEFNGQGMRSVVPRMFISRPGPVSRTAGPVLGTGGPVLGTGGPVLGAAGVVGHVLCTDTTR